MALGWMMLLKTLPWADVISTAPVVADGARKLWKTVAKKTPAENAEADAAIASAPQAQLARTIEDMQIQLTSLEQAARDSHAQMLESSKLIAALADQNTQLIAHAELSRRRIVWLAATCAALVLLGAVNLTMLLMR